MCTVKVCFDISQQTHDIATASYDVSTTSFQCHVPAVIGTGRVIAKLQKMAKLKFQVSHFLEFCRNSTSLSEAENYVQYSDNNIHIQVE